MSNRSLGSSCESGDIPLLYLHPGTHEQRHPPHASADPPGPTYSKIHKVQLAHAHVHVSIHPFLTALNGDSEDGVRTRAVLVHVCGTNRTF